MKKFFNYKILIANTIIIIFSMCVLNFIVYFLDKRTDPYSGEGLWGICREYHQFMTRDISENQTYLNLIKNENYRPIENLNLMSSSPSIILFGCSFAYGTGLEENETFSHKLGVLTKQPIFNRAFGGWGVQHMLYQLEHKEFYNEIKKVDNSKDPEFIIYLMFNHHKFRLFLPACLFQDPCYYVYYNQEKKTKEFKLRKRNFFTDKIVFCYPIFCKIFDFISLLFPDKIDSLFYDYLVACKKAQEKNLPTTKFVIIFYDKYPELSDIYMEKLREDGFILMKTEDFGIDVNEPIYQLPDTHPNALVWETITPQIVEKLRKEK